MNLMLTTLHIELKVSGGRIDSTLLYEFTNISPNSYFLTPSKTITPITTSTSNSSKKIDQVVLIIIITVLKMIIVIHILS